MTEQGERESNLMSGEMSLVLRSVHNTTFALPSRFISIVAIVGPIQLCRLAFAFKY